ncbi:MAG: DNA polymerase III subunit gamma/tau [Firmicutes bacterium]|nr:DNA polymerase III subunit gamma/tau [Bacillota bacterium]
MYTALYRRYRPKTFEEMVGQDHIVKILKNQIKTGNTAHAYLFCGTRGTGKTSAARIFAKGVNCLSEGERPCGECENCRSIQQGVFFDVIEIDAASNNRVDNIRELRESVKYPPAAGLCKVYIIDEVHMLSTGAFNALLKTLEEPPMHVIFILATTEPHKLPATILSRCLRLDFRRVSETQIKEKLREICEEEGIIYEESALSLIAANGDGSVRDSLSILEQCLPAGEKTLYRRDVVEILGTAGEEVFLELTDKVVQGDTAGAFVIIEGAARDGKDMRQFIRDWTFHFRNLMMSKFADKLEDIMNMSCENAEKVKDQGMNMEIGFLSAAITELSSTANKARYSAQPRTLLELAALKLSNPILSEEKEAIIQRIEKIEAALASGAYVDKKERKEAPGAASHVFEKEKPAETVRPELAEEENTPVYKEEIVKTLENKPKPNKVPGEGADKLWAEAFALAVKERASLKLLANDVYAKGIQGSSFVLETNSELKKNMLVQNASVFEKHLETLSGKKLLIQAAVAKNNADIRSDIKDTKAKLEELLGADKLTITE